MLVVVVGLYVQHALAYLSTRSRTDAQLAIVHRLQAANRALERERAQLNNPAVIAQDARALGMVKTGERPYVITGLRGH
jgi:cell division protein FtsB